MRDVIARNFINFNEITVKKLALVSNKVETVALMIRDPLDRTLPDVSGELVLEDIKTGQQLLINPKLVRGAYESYSLKQENLLKAACIKLLIQR